MVAALAKLEYGRIGVGPVIVLNGAFVDERIAHGVLKLAHLGARALKARLWAVVDEHEAQDLSR